MQNIYIVPLHMSGLVYLICASVLFLRHKYGERSRTILACICLISATNRSLRVVCGFVGNPSASVVSPIMLLLAIAMITINIIYAIEVISPKWLNFKRTIAVCCPLIGFSFIYIISRMIGVVYTPYTSLIEMLPLIGHFDVIFRFTLCLFIFIPIFFLFLIPYTKKYNNTNKEWIYGFIAGMTIINISYFAILIHNTYLTNTIYLYVSAACGLYIAYQELFVRLINKSQNEITVPHTDEIKTPIANKNSAGETNVLFKKLDEYMNEERAWREPDLSIVLLSQYLSSNRTSLAKAIQSGGYESFYDYISYYRINEFCEILKENRNIKIDDLFYQVGFRSRSTAFVNFKKQMDMTPYEYYKSL